MSSPPSKPPPPGSRPSRGGRGRRRVAPRQVRRRRTTPSTPIPSSATAPNPPSRGRGSRGRGRGRVPQQPVYAPDVVGLGQVAPPKPGSGRAGAALVSSMASSRKSSAMSSVGMGDMGMGTGSSTGSGGLWMGIKGLGTGGKIDMGDMDDDGFKEYFEVDEESDDELACGRNSELGEWAGKMGKEGRLLPVSLKGLRDMGEREEKKEETNDLGQRVRQGEMVLVQMPGLLGVRERVKEEKVREKVMSSVKVAEEAARRIRQVGTDLRKVGEKGTMMKMGKVRFYKSGKMEFVMDYGDVLEVEKGIEPRVCQQAVVVDTHNKTCDELHNVLNTRLVASPLFQ